MNSKIHETRPTDTCSRTDKLEVIGSKLGSVNRSISRIEIDLDESSEI